MFPWVYFISSVITQKKHRSCDILWCPEYKGKVFQWRQNFKKCQKWQFWPFKRSYLGEGAGKSWIKAGTAQHLQHHQAHQMPASSLMTRRVMFSSPGEWWSSPLLPSERPGIPQNQHFGKIQSHGSSSTRCSNLPFLRPSNRRQWQSTPVFLPGESQGLGSLVGCPLRVRTE